MALLGIARSIDSIVSRHHPIGVSTGCMADLRGDWDRQIAVACKISPFAVELSALSEPELPTLAAFLATALALPFRHLSIHGPSKELQGDEERLVAELSEVARRVEVRHDPDAAVAS